MSCGSANVDNLSLSSFLRTDQTEIIFIPSFEEGAKTCAGGESTNEKDDFVVAVVAIECEDGRRSSLCQEERCIHT